MWDLWVTYKPESRLSFYLAGPKIKKINERLLSIRPPSEIHRLPRPFVEKSKWKASEWRSWLLFYGGPCVKNILNQTYLEHFCLLSNTISVLLGTKISLESLTVEENNLKKFIHKFEELYGKDSMIFNVHALLHLTNSVKRSGPLWANSAFPFESEMFHIKQQVHGPVEVAKQIATKMQQKNTILTHISNSNLSPNCRLFCQNIFAYKRVQNYVEDDGVTFLGAAEVPNTSITFCNEEINNYVIYKQIVYKNMLCTTKNYTRAEKTNDSVVKLISKKIVEISDFITCEKGNFLIAKELILEPWKVGDCLLGSIFKVVGISETILLSMTEIQQKCICFVINNEKFTCMFPNIFEVQ